MNVCMSAQILLKRLMIYIDKYMDRESQEI